MNKKGQANDTAILLSIIIFQTFILICLGFLNVSDSEISTINSGSELFSFGNIISNIQILGWGNLLIFTPLFIGLGYIIARLIRGGG